MIIISDKQTDYTILKNKIKEDLRGKELTLQQLCKKYDLDDDFDVNCAINELVLEREIRRVGADTIFRQDATAVYLGKYSTIEQDANEKLDNKLKKLLAENKDIRSLDRYQVEKLFIKYGITEKKVPPYEIEMPIDELGDSGSASEKKKQWLEAQKELKQEIDEGRYKPKEDEKRLVLKMG